MSRFSGLRTGTDNSHGVNSPVMVLRSPSETAPFTPQAGGTPSRISRMISRARCSSDGGTQIVVCWPCASTATGIRFSFRAWRRNPERLSSSPDHTSQVAKPESRELDTLAEGAGESLALSSMSTGVCFSTASRTVSANARFEESTATSKPNRGCSGT